MKYFLFGLVLSVIGMVVSVSVWGTAQAYKIPGLIGLCFIAVCVIFSGSMLSGDRMRANYATETTENRLKRDSYLTRVFLLAIPNLVIAGLCYFFFH